MGDAKMYVGVSDNPTVRWYDDLKKEFKGLQIVRSTVLVAGGHDPSFGKTTGETMEGIIARAAGAILPNVAMATLNSENQFGAGADKPGETVHRITSWADGGKTEFESFAEHTRNKQCSKKLGTGTRALFNKLLWQDAGAKHAYVVFLRPSDDNESHEDVDDDVEGSEGFDDEGSDREWELMFPPIKRGGGLGCVEAEGSSRVAKRPRKGGDE